MWDSLDFLYLPARDFQEKVAYYSDVLGAQRVWQVKGMGTVVAQMKLSDTGPALLLAEHVKGKIPTLVYRVPDLELEVSRLKEQGVRGEELEIPHGPVFRFVAPGGQPLAIYERVRPEADTFFAGRFDR